MAEITPGVVGDYVLEVAEYADGVAPTTWTPVFGITDFTPPAIEKNLEDDSSFDSNGYGSQTATGLTWTASGTVKLPAQGNTADPGQAILRAAGKGLREEGYVHVRVYQRGATVTEEGVADCSFTVGGGSRTDLTTAEFSLAGRGALTEGTTVVTP